MIITTGRLSDRVDTLAIGTDLRELMHCKDKAEKSNIVDDRRKCNRRSVFRLWQLGSVRFTSGALRFSNAMKFIGTCCREIFVKLAQVFYVFSKVAVCGFLAEDLFEPKIGLCRMYIACKSCMSANIGKDWSAFVFGRWVREVDLPTFKDI